MNNFENRIILTLFLLPLFHLPISFVYSSLSVLFPPSGLTWALTSYSILSPFCLLPLAQSLLIVQVCMLKKKMVTIENYVKENVLLPHSFAI